MREHKIGDELAMSVRLGIVSLEAGLNRPVHLAGLEASDQIDFSHGQLYGPLTPWVVVNARTMLGLEHVDALLVRMESVAPVAAPSVISQALDLAAGPAHRCDAVEQVGRMALRVSQHLQQRDDWSLLVAERSIPLGLSPLGAHRHFAAHLDAFLSNTLAACALQDVLSEPLMLCALGAWRSVISPNEDDPGDAWRCDDSTTATLERWFADLDEDRLADAVLALDEAGPIEDEELRICLIGSTLIRKASPPPLATIVGPALREVVSHRGGRSYVDQLARLVAGLCQPPTWLPPDAAERERSRLTDLIGVIW